MPSTTMRNVAVLISVSNRSLAPKTTNLEPIRTDAMKPAGDKTHNPTRQGHFDRPPGEPCEHDGLT
jgi:hypothetical protein